MKFFLNSVETITTGLRFDKSKTLHEDSRTLTIGLHNWCGLFFELHTQAKETYFINDTGCVFCDIQAEAKETAEHQVSLIVNLE